MASFVVILVVIFLFALLVVVGVVRAGSWNPFLEKWLRKFVWLWLPFVAFWRLLKEIMSR